MGLVDARGSVKFNGEEMLGRKAYQIAHQGLGYVPENRDIFPTLTVRQNLLLGQKAAQPAARWKMDDMYRAVPAPEGARRHRGRRALRRRAADADAVPHADGRPGAGDDRRADRGPRAEDRRAGRRAVPRRSRSAASRSCWSSRSWPSRSTFPSACYVMGHGRIVFEGTPARRARERRDAQGVAGGLENLDPRFRGDDRVVVPAKREPGSRASGSCRRPRGASAAGRPAARRSRRPAGGAVPAVPAPCARSRPWPPGRTSSPPRRATSPRARN